MVRGKVKILGLVSWLRPITRRAANESIDVLQLLKQLQRQKSQKSRYKLFEVCQTCNEQRCCLRYCSMCDKATFLEMLADILSYMQTHSSY